jgi:hypothetical protein
MHANHELLGWAAAVLSSGTMCTVVLKVQFNWISKGTIPCAGGSYVCPFDKPWFAVAEMKVAMFMCLVYLGLKKIVMGSKRPFLETPRPSRFGSIQRGIKEETAPLLGADSSDAPTSLLNMALMVAVPSFLDIVQTVCGNIGLLFVSSSVYQMCRGSLVVFSAVLSVQCLGKKLHRYHLFSVALVLVAVLMVGAAGILDEANTTVVEGGSSSAQKLQGITLILLGQFFCAVQIVVEEVLMTRYQITPVLLVGLEGMWGVLMLLVILPLLSLTPSDDGVLSTVFFESTYDTFTKLANSSTLVALVLAYCLAVWAYNIASNVVTKKFNAVVRSIFEAVRVVGVWLVDLFINYVVRWTGPASPGESWTAYSFLQLGDTINSDTPSASRTPRSSIYSHLDRPYTHTSIVHILTPRSSIYSHLDRPYTHTSIVHILTPRLSIQHPLVSCRPFSSPRWLRPPSPRHVCLPSHCALPCMLLP